jgi:hypothetical protein
LRNKTNENNGQQHYCDPAKIIPHPHQKSRKQIPETYAIRIKPMQKDKVCGQPVDGKQQQKNHQQVNNPHDGFWYFIFYQHLFTFVFMDYK